MTEMSEKKSPFRRFGRELLPHAAWDGIRTLIALGAALGLSAIIGLLQWVRHHQDLVIVAAAFCTSALMLILATLLIDKNTSARSPTRQLNDLFLEEFPPDFFVHLENAKHVSLTGTHHSSTFTAYYDLFERKLRDAGTLKVLLLDPNGTAYKMAAMRFPGKITAEQERLRIQSTLTSLAELHKIAPERVEIRVIDFLVDYTAYLLDPDTDHGIIYLERYTFKTSGGVRKPKFIYDRHSSRWFEHLTTEFARLWEAATPWIASTDIQSRTL